VSNMRQDERLTRLLLPIAKGPSQHTPEHLSSMTMYHSGPKLDVSHWFRRFQHEEEECDVFNLLVCLHKRRREEDTYPSN